VSEYEENPMSEQQIIDLYRRVRVKNDGRIGLAIKKRFPFGSERQIEVIFPDEYFDHAWYWESDLEHVGREVMTE
jgi:hypothetical protein